MPGQVQIDNVSVRIAHGSVWTACGLVQIANGSVTTYIANETVKLSNGRVPISNPWNGLVVNLYNNGHSVLFQETPRLTTRAEILLRKYSENGLTKTNKENDGTQTFQQKTRGDDGCVGRNGRWVESTTGCHYIHLPTQVLVKLESKLIKSTRTTN